MLWKWHNSYTYITGFTLSRTLNRDPPEHCSRDSKQVAPELAHPDLCHVDSGQVNFKEMAVEFWTAMDNLYIFKNGTKKELEQTRILNIQHKTLKPH